VIQLRHRQPSLWHSGLAKDIADLWEPWMKEVDQLLEDAALVESVYDAQGKRHRKSRTHGRTQMKCTPNVQRIPDCWFPRSNNISVCSGAHHEWSLRTQGSTV
jgi:hypothetical protein